MYGNVRSSNINTQGLVPLEAVKQAMYEIQNPVTEDPIKEADGGAYRAYFYPVSNKTRTAKEFLKKITNL